MGDTRSNPPGEGRVPTVAEALASLPAAIVAVRTARRLSLRDAADQMGIPFNNLHRLEKGGNCTLATITAAARWLEGKHSDDRRTPNDQG